VPTISIAIGTGFVKTPAYTAGSHANTDPLLPLREGSDFNLPICRQTNQSDGP